MGVEVHALGSCAAGVVVWRHQGQLRLTVVAKACFSFDRAGALSRREPPPFASRDLHVNNQPLASVEHPTDRVPKRLLDEVVLIGAARAPGGKPVEAMQVRLAVSRGEQLLMDKQLQVVADQRDGRAQPFEHMPLGYERTYGGVGIRDNPIGRVLPDGGGNVRYAQQAAHVAGLGPLGVAWLTRAAMRGDATGIALEDAGPKGIMELPDAFDFRFFQCAPTDQHIAGLTIGDRVIMEGFFSEVPQIAFDVPDCEAACVVFGAGGDRAGSDGAGGDGATGDEAGGGRRLLLSLDLLHLHTERRTVTLSWRGSLPVADEAALERIAVATGVFEGSNVPQLPSSRAELSLLPVAGSVASAAVTTLSDADLQTLAPVATRTLPIRPRVEEAAPAPSSAPFPLAEGESPASSGAIPDAPWSEQEGQPVLPPVEGAAQTLDPFRPPQLSVRDVTPGRMAAHASSALGAWQNAPGSSDAAMTLSPLAAQSAEGTLPLTAGIAAAAQSAAEQSATSGTPLQQEMMQPTAPVRSVPSQSQRVPGAPWSQQQAPEVAPPSEDQAATLAIFAQQALAAEQNAKPVVADVPAADATQSPSTEPAAPASGQEAEVFATSSSSHAAASSTPASGRADASATPASGQAQADALGGAEVGASSAAAKSGPQEGETGDEVGETTEPRWAPIDKVSKTAPAPKPAKRKVNINSLLYGRKKD